MAVTRRSIVSPPGITMPKGLCFADVTFYLSSFSFLPVPLETNYLRMYCNDLHQIFRIGTYIGGHDQSDIIFAIASRDVVMETDFWRQSAKLIYAAFILCAGDSITDGRIVT